MAKQCENRSKTLELEEILGQELRRLCAPYIDHLATLGPRNWRTGHLALQLGSGKWLRFFPESKDLDVSGEGLVEVFLLEAVLEKEPKEMPKWPGGPASPWSSIPQCASLVGCAIEGVVPQLKTAELRDSAAEGVVPMPVRSGLLFNLSGQHYLRVKASEEVPMTLEIEIGTL